MKAIFISVFPLLIFYAVSAQITKPPSSLKPKPGATMKPGQATVATIPAATQLVVADTIPKPMYQYYSIDKGRYLKYVNTNLNDSVKLAKAGTKDWDDFQTAKNKLEETIKNNPHNNISNYISTDRDFKSIGLVDKAFQLNTAKVCLRQLIFNINLSAVLLNKATIDNTDLQLVSMAIRNIDTLCLAYIVPFVTKLAYSMKYPKIQFKVFDSTGIELTKAECYLVSPYICRSVACLSCKNIVPPCETQTLGKIIGEKDYVFDCANPTALSIAPGNYHIFIVDKGNIISYKLWSTSAADITSDLEPKTINLNIR